LDEERVIPGVCEKIPWLEEVKNVKRMGRPAKGPDFCIYYTYLYVYILQIFVFATALPA
jgi:hypothetical protein